MSQKRDPHTWLSQRNGKGPSDATAAMFKAESEGRVLSGSSSLVYDVRTNSGGRKLKAVDSGMDLFGEDDEDEGQDGVCQPCEGEEVRKLEVRANVVGVIYGVDSVSDVNHDNVGVDRRRREGLRRSSTSVKREEKSQRRRGHD